MGHSEAEKHDAAASAAPPGTPPHATERKPGEPPAPEPIPVPPPEPPLAFTPDAGDFSEEHALVFSALATAQEARAGEPVSVGEIALTVPLPPDRLRELLRDLTITYRLVDVTDNPGRGPRYAVKPRL